MANRVARRNYLSLEPMAPSINIIKKKEVGTVFSDTKESVGKITVKMSGSEARAAAKKEPVAQAGQTAVDEAEAQYYDWKLARAYVPFQKYRERYDPMKGLMRGTIFPELDMPYVPRER